MRGGEPEVRSGVQTQGTHGSFGGEPGYQVHCSPVTRWHFLYTQWQQPLTWGVKSCIRFQHSQQTSPLPTTHPFHSISLLWNQAVASGTSLVLGSQGRKRNIPTKIKQKRKKIPFSMAKSKKLLKGEYLKMHLYDESADWFPCSWEKMKQHLIKYLQHLVWTLTCAIYCFYPCTGFPNFIVRPMGQHHYHLPPNISRTVYSELQTVYAWWMFVADNQKLWI